MNIEKITSKILTQTGEIIKKKGVQELETVVGACHTQKSTLHTNPLAPLSRDVVDLRGISAFEKELCRDFEKAPLTVTIGGKDVKWSRFQGSQMGSQDAFWAKNEETGELFYVKFAQDKAKEGHILSEIEANKLYRLAGLETPEIVSIVINGKTQAMASKYIEGLAEENTLSLNVLRKGFAADAWLANWDSLLPGNTFTKGGKLVKVDNGGALRYRAMGELKPNFGDKVDELVTLVDGRNWVSSEVYSGMTHQELVDSFKSVCRVTDKQILKSVENKELAQTLINRKNFMKEVLDEMEKSPRTKEDLSDYFSKIMSKVAEKKVFNTDTIIEDLSKVLNSKISSNPQFLEMPSTKTLSKDLVTQIKELEKRGVNVSREDIVNLLKEISENGLEMNIDKIRSHFRAGCDMEEHYTGMFTNLYNLTHKNQPKQGEKMSSYVSRLVKMRERKIKQLDEMRIKTIKSKLKYKPELECPKNTVLTEDERITAIRELQKAREKDLALDIHSIPKISDNATDAEIYDAWQKAHLGAFEFSTEELQRSVMGIGGRYNSKHPIKTKTQYETIAEKDYAQEFENEPVYHWFSMKNPEVFVKKQLPKVGEIYTPGQRQCCSTHKTYAEMDYGDHMLNQNIKFIIHPKSETSRAYNLGYNQEVIYTQSEQFRILDKELVEYIDPYKGTSCLRWEIHMQEV